MHMLQRLFARWEHRDGAFQRRLPRRAGAAAAPQRLLQQCQHWALLVFLLLGLALSPMGAAAVAHAASAAGGASSAHWLGRHVLRGLSHQTAIGTASSLSNASCSGNCGTPPLSNPNNNPVQHDPRVYTVYWGSKWNSDTSNARSTANGFFQHLAGGQFNNVLDQYTDGVGAPNNFVHNDGHWAGEYLDTSSPNAPLDMTGLENEAFKALQANPGWITDTNTQVMIFPQQGTVYNTFAFPDECGEHDAARASNGAVIVYSLIMYGDDPTCAFYGNGSTSPAAIAPNMLHVAAHEYAEAATDPGLNAWRTSDGYEIADICNADNYWYQPADGGGTQYPVQELWSNYQKGCEFGWGAEYSSPDTAYPYGGMHTVQGAILGVYNATGGPSGVLHEPLTEETPIGNGGRVSYFTNGCSGTTKCAGIYWSPQSGTYYVRSGDFGEYQQWNEANGILGFPISNEATMNSGTVQYFNGDCGGTTLCAGIYYSPGSLSHAVHGGDFGEYRNQREGNGPLGFPLTRETPMNGGTVQYFNGLCGGGTHCAAIYYSGGTLSHAVYGLDFGDYKGLSEANGPLAFPLSDEISISGGTVALFTANYACGRPGPSGGDGAIYYSSGTGSHAVYGCIYAFYENTSGDTGGPLGFPLSDEQGITDLYGHAGRVNYFTANHACGSPGPSGSDGAIYWTGSAAFQVYGCIYAEYITYGGGGPGGPLGFPTSSEYTNAAGYRENTFENGTITWVNGQAQICLGVTC